MTQPITYLATLDYVQGLQGWQQEADLPQNQSADAMDLCLVCYYAGRDNDRSNTWKPNANNWKGTGKNSYENAMAVAWNYYAMENRARREEQGLTHLAIARDQNSKMKVSDPDKYDGSRNKYDTYVMQLNLKYSSQTELFTTLQAKLTYAGSYLTGNAAEWFEPPR